MASKIYAVVRIYFVVLLLTRLKVRLLTMSRQLHSPHVTCEEIEEHSSSPLKLLTTHLIEDIMIARVRMKSNNQMMKYLKLSAWYLAFSSESRLPIPKKEQ